ncbi:C39 family peptidase [Flavobacterium sp. '19STA2R22 D10 B1']|uniref:C39 family peptidase n=1 Tax=Flavobacterium aerium TaxID=3037261 RepID=UPI00278C34AE|nr:C39 family peptidase [Flavobacterium sp. '19STA2R22 D10 B1']
MKKSALFTILFLTLLLINIITISCSNEQEKNEIANQNSITSVSIDEAKAYLNKIGLLKPKEELKGEPTSSSNEYVTVFQDYTKQEPINDSKEKMTVIPAFTIHPEYYSRVIIFKVDGEVISRVFSMEWDESMGSKHYTGRIIVTDLKGNYVNGFKIDKGLITHYLVPKDNTQSIYFGKDKPIDGGWLDEVTVGGGGGGNFNALIPYLLLNNTYNGNGGQQSGGWGFGGSGGGSGINNYSNSLVEKLLQNLPTTVPKQEYGGACVPTSASFVASYFGSTQSPEFMMNEYAVAHNMNQLQEAVALFDGLGHDQQVSFLIQQFNMSGVNTIEQMTSAIDNGYPVLTTIVDENSIPYHEVTIVGYNSVTNQFTIANTVPGSYQIIPYTNVDLSLQSWQITGVK